MERFAVALASAAIVMCPMGLEAQTRFERQVQDQIEASGEFLADRGYALVFDIHEGSLDDAESDDFWVTLDGGVEYALLGVCDEDCDDIDLALYDDDDDQIDSDYQLDDAPVVRVTPARSGRYRVHVYLASCETEPCYYGVGVFGREESGGNEWEEQVNEQIEAAGRAFEDQGFNQTHEPRSGSLDDGESYDFTVRLRAGTSYTIVGVCDEDCDDIDLAIYDEGDDEMDSDYELDDFPILEVRPASTGSFRIHVYMANCDTEPCYYGVGVYGKKGKN